MPTQERYLTPPAVGKLLGVNADRVVGWIKAGTLRASNVSDGIRPRWRISPADLEAYLTARSNQAKHSEARGRKRQRQAVTRREWV